MAAYTVTKCLLGTLLQTGPKPMSQAELSRRTGINKSQISAYVNQRYANPMDLAHARSIASALELTSPYDLYEWYEELPSGRTSD